jgi:O-antigen/teichoic acid export membrane protein
MLIEEMKEDKTAPVLPNPAQSRLGTKIIRNVMFGGLRYVFIAPIPFVMTPLILHKIGVAGYGTWAVFLGINGLTSLADLGLFGTLSKFVAQYHAQRDFTALARLVNSGLTLFLLVSVVVSSALWVASPRLVSMLFGGSTVPRAELLALLRCFPIVIAANILSQLFASVTTGLQRLDLTNMISAANVLLSAVFGALLLFRGWGLRGLVFGYIGSGIVTVICYVIIIRRLLPQIAMNPMRFDRTEARKMLGYSLQLYVTQAAVVVHNQAEKVFLAMLTGVGAAGWYDIASDVALKVRGVIGLILSPVLPAASELDALGDESRMKELYYRAHKYLALFGVPVVCYVVVVSKRFVELWIGSNLKVIALPLSVLLVASFFNLATGPGFFIFAGSGYLKPGIQSALLGMILNVVLSLALIYKFGFTGAVLGTSISLTVAAIFFLYVFHRRTGYLFLPMVESYLKPVFCSVVPLTALFVVRPALSWFGLVAVGIVFGMLYSTAILLSGFLDEYDWSRIETLLPMARYARKIGWTA